MPQNHHVMNASTPMTRDVFVVPPETSLADAWSLMQRERIRHLPVVRGSELLGILSDRDILVRASLNADGAVVVERETLVGEAMTAAPFVCGVSTTVDEIVQLMTEKKIDAMPVVSATDRLIGLVTSTDLLLLLREDEPRTLPFDFSVHEVKLLGD